MISIMVDTPEELKRLFEIMRSNNPQAHVDTVAREAMKVRINPLDSNPYTR